MGEVRCAVAALVFGSVSSAQVVLWDNGPLVTDPGAHATGGDLSRLQNVSLSEGSLGHLHGLNAGYRMADDFEVGAIWQVSSIRFFAYQTNATGPTITGYSVNIWDGSPGAQGSSIVASSTQIVGGQATNIYRVTETDTAGTKRRIQMTEVGFTGVELAAGRYWVDWAATGSLVSGPWQPTVTRLGVTNDPWANALWYDPNQKVWSGLLDTGSATPDELPFTVRGVVIPVPGPGSSAVLAAGGVAGVLAWRRRG